MADGSKSFELSMVDSVAQVPAEAWDQCALAAGGNPFTSHRFLSALEVSGSVGEETGWIPRPLILRDGDDILGVAPLYLKLHSQGEYVFDHHWADAYHRAGGRYYPKLVAASPFSPVTGPRFLAGKREYRKALASGAVSASKQLGVSSLHVNFVTPGDKEVTTAEDYLNREGIQYHWFNKDYLTFDDFLDTLMSRKRKSVKRERRQANDAGLVIRRLRGKDIKPKHWDAFWDFYLDTGARKWGQPYLTRSFFEEIAGTMSEEILLVIAESDETPVAGAMNIIGCDALYGRYWGTTDYYAFLHFEVCYYQAIEFAIEERLDRVEAGAQGEHKIARGYRPVTTHSIHWLRDPSFRDAIDRYLEAERSQNAEELEYCRQHEPYKKGDA
ncbi:MAG: GNAT family N-acetyltransferase [Pseudomonadota bacterium]